MWPLTKAQLRRGSEHNFGNAQATCDKFSAIQAVGQAYVSDSLKTDETCRLENHLPQKLNGSSIRHRHVGCRSES